MFLNTILAAVLVAALLAAAACAEGPAADRSSAGEAAAGRWSPEEAWEWYNKQPWLVGFNFLPSTAVNDTEMWQKETFDPETIDRELGWAEKIGYNSCRVFLQYIVWKADPEGFKKRFEQFLALADRHGITAMPIFFDDCAFAGKEPYPGKQDDPVPGVHNSGWVPSPGGKIIADKAAWADLEKYVKTTVGAFGRDRRVVIWDLYNEPSTGQSLPLVEAAFRWAREAKPMQPLTTSIFGGGKLPGRIVELSDIINIHNYNDLGNVKAEIAARRRLGRPIVVSEWMCRGQNSRFEPHLPYFRQERIACYNWGLVAGRTQTYYPWGSPRGAPEPKVWHHDVLRRDGTPFDPAEIVAIGAAGGALKMRQVVPTSESAPAQWRYTIESPPADWADPKFDDAKWLQAPAPFGTLEPEHGRRPGTPWKAADIWLRRTVVMPQTEQGGDLYCRVYHDEDVEIYLNGRLAGKAAGYTVGYVLVPVMPEGRAAVKAGSNTLAVHCRQTVGGQYIDVGIMQCERRT